MGGNAYIDGLNYDLIQRAVHGEKDALEEILRIYEPFHDALVTREVIDPDGRIHKEIDEDKKIEVQMHLLEVIQTMRLVALQRFFKPPIKKLIRFSSKTDCPF